MVVNCPHCEAGYSAEYIELKNLWYGQTPYTPDTPYTADHPVIKQLAKTNCAASNNFSVNGIQNEADRLAATFNRQMAYHLDEDDALALTKLYRPHNLVYEWDGEMDRTKPLHEMPRAKEINDWAMASALGHDAINAHIVLSARLLKQGISSKCRVCKGEGLVDSLSGCDYEQHP